jgi:hypothetical protein
MDCSFTAQFFRNPSKSLDLILCVTSLLTIYGGAFKELSLQIVGFKIVMTSQSYIFHITAAFRILPSKVALGGSYSYTSNAMRGDRPCGISGMTSSSLLRSNTFIA